MSFSWIPSHPRVLELEDLVGDVFSIHDTATRSGNQIVVLRGEFLRSAEMVYETLAPRFKERGYVPVLRTEEGFDVVMAYPAPPGGSGGRLWLHLLLFVLTVLSTLWAGASQETGLMLGPSGLIEHWQLGLAFTVPLLTILGVHEFGHYFVARAYGLDVSLPYFIPFPLNPLVGTLGAVIRIQSPFESRKALFDVGIAGPLAGLAVAIPVVAWGLINAEMATFDPDTAGVTVFSEPLLFQWMAELIVGERPPGMDLVMNPYLMAGWLGFLITALNLVPISQLDGGHIAYAILGRFHRHFAWAVFGLAALVTLAVSRSYLLMLLFVFMMGIEHPPALNDITKIGWPRILLGALTFLLGFTLITLQPIRML